MDRGAWWATVHGVTKSQTTEQLSARIAHLFIGCAGSSLLRGLFSGFRDAGLLSRNGLPIAVASPVAEWTVGCMGFSSCGSWAVEHRPRYCGAWA